MAAIAPTTAPKTTKMNTGPSAEPSECLEKAILLLVDCDKCGQEASKLITNVIIFAWGSLLAWLIVEMYRIYKYTSSEEETNTPHDKKLNKKRGK